MSAPDGVRCEARLLLRRLIHMPIQSTWLGALRNKEST